MINRKHRFHGYNSLRFAYRSGRTVRGPLFSVTYALNPRRRHYRAAVVISRKVHKSAFARNRIRRRLYEIIRQLAPAIDQPFDIIITVFHDTVLSGPSTNLNRLLKRQLESAGILNKSK